MIRSIDARPAAAPWIALAVCFLAPAPADAVPVVSLSWDACSPIVNAKSPTPGQPISSLFVSVVAMEPHQGYAVSVYLAGNFPCRSTTMPVPDAWRFDTPGCQGASLGRVSLVSTNKACPPLASSTPEFQLSGIVYNESQTQPSAGPIGGLRAFAFAAYQGRIVTPDPNVRYQMCRIDFDHTYSVDGTGTPGETCGGFETPVCAALWSGIAFTVQGRCGLGLDTDLAYVDAEGSQLFMQVQEGYASFGLTPGTAFSCFEMTPAAGASWGSIKAQYR